MAEGFDLIAAEEVLTLRDKGNAVRLIAACPFDDGRSRSERYARILGQADESVTLADNYSRGAYFVRNEYMVDNSSYLICYVDYAKKQGLTVVNLWERITPEVRPPKMIDNKRNGRVIDELRGNLKKGSRLSVISAYFTIYAYAELKRELSRVEGMRFLFTEPTFIKSDNELTREFYIDHNPEKRIYGNEFEIKLRNEMRQAAIAKECAKWLSEKVEVKSLKRPNPAQPRLLHIDNAKDAVSINGTFDFTTDGLGVTHSNRIDSNMCIYGKDFTMHFLRMFDELWSDGTAVEDVKAKLLEQMQTIYRENTPEFIYFVTLFNIFHDYLDELTEDRIMRSGTGFKDTMIWNKLYKFQSDGVMGAIDKIERLHNRRQRWLR
jgi:hypothetical protein